MRLFTEHLPAGQQKIAVEIQAGGEEFARSIITYFETQAQAGVRFRDEQTVELGWMLLLLRQVDNVLEVFEPDFACMPIRWCRGVNNAIKHLHLQRAVCDLFDCEPLFPTMRQAGVISPKFFDRNGFNMSRDAPADSDSGWVFAESGYAGSEGKFCSLYQISLQKPEIVPFLALPDSSRVTIRPGFREVTFNSITKSSTNDDDLQKLAVSNLR